MSTDRGDIVAKITEILSQVILADNPHSRTIDADTALLSSGLSLDSVAVLELVVEIEDRFEIQFDDEDLKVELFANVGSLADYVSQRQTGA